MQEASESAVHLRSHEGGADRPQARRGVKYLTTDELARLFRTSTESVRYWRTNGSGPRWIKIGRRVLYDAADVQDFVTRQEAIAGGGAA